MEKLFYINKYGLVLFAIIIFCSRLFAQSTPIPTPGGSYILAHIDESQIQNADPLSNSILQTIFSDYSVWSYENAFPGAENISGAEYLTFSKEIIASDTTNLSSLKNALDQSGVYDLVEIIDAPILLESFDYASLESCNNPMPITDPNSNAPINYLEMMQFPCAWEITEGDPNMTVAITDTRFNPNHIELLGKIDLTKGDYVDSNDDEYNHGFAVAGAITALHNETCVAGAAYKTKVSGYFHNFNNVWDAFMDGNQVINCSWLNNSKSDQVREFLKLVTSRVPVVFGACGESVSYYHDIPGVIVVGILDKNLNYDNYGGMCGSVDKNVDIGVPVRGATADEHMWQIGINDGCRANFGGTSSIAAPIVSSAIALMYSVNPCLLPYEVEGILKQTADPVPNIDEWEEVNTGALNAYEAVLAAQALASNTSPNDIVISTDTEWNIPHKVNGTITIENQATLTVNSTIRFDDAYGKIIVKAGGELVVDGGILINGCENEFWDGIEVEGNPELSQFGEGNQGRVELRNNTQIRNARIGVSLHKRHPFGEAGGGILEATNTIFINNQTAISFSQYDNFLPVGDNPTYFNRSFIKDCTFTLEEDEFSTFPFDSFESHIRFYRVNGVSIFDCLFNDGRVAVNVANEDMLGSGIYSVESQIQVNNSTFKRLLFGFDAANINSIRSFSIRNSIFRDNFYNINIRAVNNFTIKNCEFKNIGLYPFKSILTSFSQVDHTVGIFIDRSTGFIVENNYFSTGSSSEPRGVGICTRNTNLSLDGVTTFDANLINQNTFSSIPISTLANKNNRGDEFEGGLVYNCNNYQLALSTSIGVIDGSIADNQISELNLATGNILSIYAPGNVFKDIDNVTGNVINYFYFQEDDSQNPNDFPAGRVFKFTANENLCEEIIDSDQIPDPELDEVKLNFYDKVSSYDLLKSQYNSLIDNGNTEYLKELVNSMTLLNKSNVKDELIEISPFLSKEVAQIVTENLIFNSSEKLEILCANPEVLRIASFENEIKENDLFNAEEYSILDQFKQQYTNRFDLEIGIAVAFAGMQKTANRLIRHELSDSTNINFDNIQILMDQKQSLEAAYAKVDAYFTDGDYDNAIGSLTIIPIIFDFDPEQNINYLNYQALLNWMIAVEEGEANLLNLSENELTEIRNIANNGAYLSTFKAQNIINLVEGRKYQHEPILEMPMTQSIPQVEKQSQSISDLNLVIAFPNPTAGNTVFDYELPKGIESGQLIIRDIRGKSIFEISLKCSKDRIEWNPKEEIPSGVYFYHIVYDKGKSQIKKLVITK